MKIVAIEDLQVSDEVVRGWSMSYFPLMISVPSWDTISLILKLQPSEG